MIVVVMEEIAIMVSDGRDCDRLKNKYQSIYFYFNLQYRL
jgi:hypothetical protein